MGESKYNLIATSKMFVEKHYRGIPSFKPIKRTRLFDEGVYDSVPGLSLYKKFSHLFGDNIVSIDRTNTITTPFNTELHKDLMLPQHYSNKSFSDCCDERAVSCLRSAKQLYVMYSGGIDSITMLSALIRNRTKETITLLMTEGSINRNKEFYNKHIRGKFNILPAQSFDKYISSKDSMLISGECGDEIFGTSFIQNLMYRSSIAIDVTMEEPTMSTVSLLTKYNPIIETEEEIKQHRKLLELLFAVAETSPVELDSVYKFFWWLNFVLGWNVSYTRLMSYSKDVIVPEQNYVPFFASSDFQSWSVNHVDELTIHKNAAKKYIQSYDDTLDMRAVVKTRNINDICFNKPQVFAIGTQLTPIVTVTNDVFKQENSFI